jgi:hypothetical protein
MMLFYSRGEPIGSDTPTLLHVVNDEGEASEYALIDRTRFERLRTAALQLRSVDRFDPSIIEGVERFYDSDDGNAAQTLQPGDLDPLP